MGRTRTASPNEMESERYQASAGKSTSGGAAETLALPISVAGLPRDVSDALVASGIATLADFVARDPLELVGIHGVGRGSIRRVRRWLELRGLGGTLSTTALRPADIASKRSAVRLELAGLSIPAVPEGLTEAPIPAPEVPSRVANLFRRHGIHTLGDLHRVLVSKTSLEGFGAGTRHEVIESLPRIYLVAAQSGASSIQADVLRERIVDVVSRLRNSTGRPVRIEQVAQSWGIDEERSRVLAVAANDILFLDPWCLTPDEVGVQDAIQIATAGALGEWVIRSIRAMLSPNEYEVMARWVGLDRQPSRHGEIARSLGRSRERIRQLRERALMKVSSTPATYSVLAVMSRSILKATEVMSDDQFSEQFNLRYGQLLGPTLAPGIARLCLKASIGMRRGNVPR